MNKVAITGAYLSQNQGSAAMSLVTCAELRQLGFDVELFSKYPTDDRDLAGRHKIPLRPTNQMVYTGIVIPLLLLARLIPGLHGWIRRRFFRDIVLFYDIGGITFAESRGFSGFLINLTWLLLPLLLDIPVVKGSQALGPFDSWYLRRIGVPLLRRVARTHARGAYTQDLLERSHIGSKRASDIAYLLPPEAVSEDSHNFEAEGAPVVIVPSSVVMKRFDSRHGSGSYLDLLTELIQWLLEAGYPVALLAHSYRRGQTLNSNDYPLCVALKERFASTSVHLYDVFGKSPNNLKHWISLSRLVITGRFHGMVAALGTGTPVVVTSWSHKYKEVLQEFGMDNQAVDWREMTAQSLIGLTKSSLRDEAKIRAQLEEHLPAVKTSATQNFSGISELARSA